MHLYQLKSLNDNDYGIYFAGQCIRIVNCFQHSFAAAQVNRANHLLAEQAKSLTDHAKRVAAGNRALQICSRLKESRARLTKKTIIARNKAGRMYA